MWSTRIVLSLRAIWGSSNRNIWVGKRISGCRAHFNLKHDCGNKIVVRNHTNSSGIVRNDQADREAKEQDRKSMQREFYIYIQRNKYRYKNLRGETGGDLGTQVQEIG